MSELIQPTQTAGRDSVEPKNSESQGPTEREGVPTTFRELALRVACAVLQDIHIKGSGLIFFALLGYGALYPKNKEQCEQLAALAGTYLFGAAINRRAA
jgi:hypothetical protein